MMPNTRFEDIQEQLYRLRVSLEDYALDNTATWADLYSISQELDQLKNRFHTLLESHKKRM